MKPLRGRQLIIKSQTEVVECWFFWLVFDPDNLETSLNDQPSVCRKLHFVALGIKKALLCVWHGLLQQKVKILKMAPISSPSSRVVCPLEASSFHNTLVFGFQTICDVTNYSRETRFSTSTGEIYTSSNECENSLLVSNSPRTSFYKAKLKH